MSDLTDPFGSKAWAVFGTKLLDVARSGFGMLFYRQLVTGKARADVEAAKILALGEHEIAAIRALPPEPRVRALPASNDLVIDVDWEEPEPLAKRAHDRLEYQEQKRQLNTENIVRLAAQEGAEDEQVSAEPVEDGWAARFFTSAQDVSNEEMQRLWAKLLAGEVKRPGTFSLRTLEVLRNLSPTEAALFVRGASLSTDSRIFADALEAYGGVSFADLLLLQEAQLLNLVQVNSTPMKAKDGNVLTWSLGFKSVALVASGDGSLASFNVWKLTGPGKELASLTRGDDDLLYIAHLKRHLARRGLVVHVSKASWEGGTLIVHSDQPVVLPPLPPDE